MQRHFTLEYWIDDGWYVGKLKEAPGIFSQGASLKELEENIRDAYALMMEEEVSIPHPGAQIKDIVMYRDIQSLKIASVRLSENS